MDRKRLELRLSKLRRAYNDFVDLRASELAQGANASICQESFKMIETLIDDDSTRIKKDLGIFSHDHKEGRKRKKKAGRPKQKKVIYKITSKDINEMRYKLDLAPAQLDFFKKVEA